MAERDIDWRAGDNPEEPTDIQISAMISEPVVAGQMAHLDPTSQRFFRAFVSKSCQPTENSSSFWDDRMIPIWIYTLWQLNDQS